MSTLIGSFITIASVNISQPKSLLCYIRFFYSYFFIAKLSSLIFQYQMLPNCCDGFTYFDHNSFLKLNCFYALLIFLSNGLILFQWIFSADILQIFYNLKLHFIKLLIFLSLNYFPISAHFSTTSRYLVTTCTPSL